MIKNIRKSARYKTIPETYLRNTDGLQGKSAVLYRQGKKWCSLSYEEMTQSIIHLATSLKSRGLKRGDRAAIISENRYEYYITELAVISCGAAVVPLYINSAPSQIEFILNDSSSKFLFFSRAKDITRKVNNLRPSLCADMNYVFFEGAETTDFAVAFCDLIKEGKESAQKKDFFEGLLQLEEGDIANLIYTSGTTGDPKGVPLTHANLLANAYASLDAIHIDSDSVTLSILPLSHALEKTCSFLIFLFKGATIAVCDNLNTLSKTLREVKPTHIIAVPKLYETIYQNIIRRINRRNAITRKLFSWGLESALKNMKKNMRINMHVNKPDERKSTLSKLADTLVFKRIRRGLGGNIKLMLSGGAPLPVHVGEFFNALDMPLIEGYGLTEASPVVSCNRVSRNKSGTVGLPITGVEVKISKEGEILVRGPNVMKGYHNREDSTKEAIDDQGWLHTGDLGSLDEEGFLTVTGRKKDIIVTSGGKKVSPQNLEAMLLTSPYIKQAVIIGEGKDFISALIVPNLDSSNQMDDTQHRLQIESVIAEHIKAVNSDLSNFEKIRKFKLLDGEFSIDRGELTPTFKIRRSVINERYSNVVREIYGAR